MIKKIVVIGADGQLAFDLIRIFRSDYKVIEARRGDFDITDQKAVEKFIFKLKPNIVINTAAFHKTEDCEKDPEKSFLVNGIGAFNVSKAAGEIGAIIIFISSDYVFDGSKKGFKEDDLPNPLNIYGASKLAGETLTKITNPKHLVVRSSWLFGIKQSGKGHNFVDLMIEKARRGEEVKVVDDQIGSPTYTYDLSLKIKELIEKKVPYGIYHIANSGICSWYQFAKEIFRQTKIKIKISKIKTNMSINQAKRPKYSILLNEKLSKANIKPLRNWQNALKDYLKEKY